MSSVFLTQKIVTKHYNRNCATRMPEVASNGMYCKSVQNTILLMQVVGNISYV